MKNTVLLSGGQDSTTCLLYAIKTYGVYNVDAVFFDYGQRHQEAEYRAAKIVSCYAGVRLRCQSIVLPCRSALIGNTGSLSREKDGLPSSFVPGRNLLLLAMAASMVYSDEKNKHRYRLIIGANAVDYSGYPDCRENFISAAESAISAAMNKQVQIEAPLLNLTKAQIVTFCSNIGGLGMMRFTHTCYEGQTPPCGACPACKIRTAGFKAAGIIDPLEHGQTNET